MSLLFYIFRFLDHINTLGLQGEMGALFHRWQLSRQIRIHNDKSGEIDGLIVRKYCDYNPITKILTIPGFQKPSFWHNHKSQFLYNYDALNAIDIRINFRMSVTTHQITMSLHDACIHKLTGYYLIYFIASYHSSFIEEMLLGLMDSNFLIEVCT